MENGNRMYQSHPWVLGVRPDGTAFGVIFDSSWKASLSTKSDRIDFETEGALFRIFVIDRESPQAVLRGLAELTGTIKLPPRWALGYQQSRYSYTPEARVREVADTFRAKKVPCDGIWMDIDYMDRFRVFTFDAQTFPDPKGLNQYLHEKGFHSVWMIDPGVKVDPGYSVYETGTAGDVWVKTADGKSYRGVVWPGSCVFPDFTRPETREWWAALYKDFMAVGVDGVWNDMNEPTVFDGPLGTMPYDNWHRGGGGLPASPYLLYHNVYGRLMVEATHDGIMAANSNLRPFVRGHAFKGANQKEPWAFGQEVEDAARIAIERRYRLLPYLYTLFHDSSITGLPIMRPVFFADPKDPKLRAEETAFLIGKDPLVIPDWAEKPALPGGIWEPLALVRDDNGKYQARLKIRGGAIIPIGKIVQNTNQRSLNLLTLLVCLNRQGNATGALYWDDGNGWRFQSGRYSLQHFMAKRRGNSVTVKLASSEGRQEITPFRVNVEVITRGGVRRGSGSIKSGITIQYRRPQPR